MIINVRRYSCKVPVIFLRFKWNLNFLDRFQKKSTNMNFHRYSSSGSSVVPCGHTNKRTDRRDETNSRFLQILRKHLKMYAYTTEDVIQRPNSKNLSYFSIQNLFLILLPEAIMSKARKIIIIIVRAKYRNKRNATITVLLVFKISSTCFGRTFANLQ